MFPLPILRGIWKKARWHFIDIKARLGIGNDEILRQGRRPAYGPAMPRQLSVPMNDECFDTHDALHGSWSSQEQCAGIPNAVWVGDAAAGECIRYYPAGFRPEANELALVYLPGDVVLRTSQGVRLAGRSYTSKSPNELLALMNDWASDAGAPAIYLGRPGIFGSSGDHDRRRQPYEIDLVDRALDLIKDRHAIERFIVVGQSGGGQVAAALLNRRNDISAAILTAGLLSVHDTVRIWRRRRPVPGGSVYPVEALYDPMLEVDKISRDPTPQIYVISDPRDTVVSLASQMRYLKRLLSAGIKANHIFAHAEAPKHHDLGAHGRKAAALLSKGADARQIRKALVDMDET